MLCSTQLSIKFQLLTITKYTDAFNLSDIVLKILINVKIPTIVGISTFLSTICCANLDYVVSSLNAHVLL